MLENVEYVLSIRLRNCSKGDFIKFIKALFESDMIIEIIKYDCINTEFLANIQLNKNGGVLEILSILSNKYDICYLELVEKY